MSEYGFLLIDIYPYKNVIYDSVAIEGNTG